MCQLGKVSRPGFYRSLQEQAPLEESMEVRSAIQQIALEHRRRYAQTNNIPKSSEQTFGGLPPKSTRLVSASLVAEVLPLLRTPVQILTVVIRTV